MTFLVRHSCDLRKEKQTLSLVPVLGKGHNFCEGEGAGGGGDNVQKRDSCTAKADEKSYKGSYGGKIKQVLSRF